MKWHSAKLQIQREVYLSARMLLNPTIVPTRQFTTFIFEQSIKLTIKLKHIISIARQR